MRGEGGRGVLMHRDVSLGLDFDNLKKEGAETRPTDLDFKQRLHI